MLAGIREILIITTPEDASAFQHLLGDGAQFGVDLHYAVQPRPEGLAQAFIIGRGFIGQSDCSLVLGDNIFYGHGLGTNLARAVKRDAGATIFAYRVRDPERYGVVELDKSGRAVSIEEKPQQPRSHYAVTGLYFYDKHVVDMAAELRPSVRGELEISDINAAYMKRGELHVEMLGRGTAWLDTGTHDSLLQAANFIETVEQRQGLKVCCVEEIAYRLGYITPEELEQLARPLEKSGYGKYLLDLLRDDGLRS
jgi:glucose-1-phosphate thymidylyltransferase